MVMDWTQILVITAFAFSALFCLLWAAYSLLKWWKKDDQSFWMGRDAVYNWINNAHIKDEKK